MPIAHGNQKVEDIFIGFDNKGFPNIVTTNEDIIQMYSKCSGSIAITNFSCDKVMSELLSFEMDNERCKFLLNKLTTGN